MTSVHNGIHSENTPIRPTPMATQSPRRSPNCRLNGPSRHPAETRGLRHTANYGDTRPCHELHGLPVPNAVTLRHNHNQLNLPTPNRPKVTHRLLLRKSHSPGYRGCSNPDTMKLHRGNSPNNCPRSHVVHNILSS